MIPANQRLKPSFPDIFESPRTSLPHILVALPRFLYNGKRFDWRQHEDNTRAFSSTKKLITLERNRLAEDIIEASECLKNWWDHGLIRQQSDG